MRKADYLPLMATQVVVTRTLYRVREGNERSWHTMAMLEPRTGWVVGVRSLQNGTYHPPSGGTGFTFDGPDDSYEPGCLACKTRTPCIMVVFWPTERPVPVPLNGFRPATDADPKPYPAAGFGTGRDREVMIQSMKDDSKTWPRDRHGRFSKGV